MREAAAECPHVGGANKLSEAADILAKLADSPYLAKVLPEHCRKQNARALWMAYHALLCEELNAGDRERVAAFWSRSPETVQDALTDYRQTVTPLVQLDVWKYRRKEKLDGEGLLGRLESAMLVQIRDQLAALARRKK
ncbi:MAG: hypothetical protein IRZ28_18030 [Steroidobacteraceae bacterium]|nr:hypothetical protein [Steroidobacteraceae bacterium]